MMRIIRTNTITKPVNSNTKTLSDTNAHANADTDNSSNDNKCSELPSYGSKNGNEKA